MLSFAFIQQLSMPEIIIIFLVVLLFFGGKRLPTLAKSMGKSITEFKKGIKDSSEIKMDEKEDKRKIES